MCVYLREFVHSTWPSIPKDDVNCENHNHIFIGFHKLTMVNEFVLDDLSSSWTDSIYKNKSNSKCIKVALHMEQSQSLRLVVKGCAI